jgi:hypothetical protein
MEWKVKLVGFLTIPKPKRYHFILTKQRNGYDLVPALRIRDKRSPDSASASNNLTILTQKIVSKLSEI